MVKATKKIIKKFTNAIHGHPLFAKILFEKLTFFTQGNGITRFQQLEHYLHQLQLQLQLRVQVAAQVQV